MRSKSDPISMLKDRMITTNMASLEEIKVHLNCIFSQQLTLKSRVRGYLPSYLPSYPYMSYYLLWQFHVCSSSLKDYIG